MHRKFLLVLFPPAAATVLRRRHHSVCLQNKNTIAKNNLTKSNVPTFNGCFSSCVRSLLSLVINKTTSTTSKVLIVFILTCVTQEIGICQQFKAEGHITYSMESKQFGRSYEHTMPFAVERIGNTWKIRTINEDVSGTSTSLISFYEVGCDGTNIYYFEQNDEQKLRSIVDAKTLNSERNATAFGRVMRADAPRLESSLIYPIWLALASCPYLKEVKSNRVVAPFFIEEGFQPQVSLPAKWDIKDGAFVSNITWFSEGSYPIVGSDGKAGYEKYPPPYDAGFLQAHFEVAAWTNVGGASYPQRFTLLDYDPSGVSNGVTNFVVGCIMSGIVESIHSLDFFSPVPKITSKSIVKDFRYNFGDQTISYLTTSNWFSDKQITDILQKKHLVPVSFSGLDKRRKIILAVMIAFSIISLLVFFVKIKTSNKNET